MTQQATTAIQQAANGGQVATQRKPVDKHNECRKRTRTIQKCAW